MNIILLFNSFVVLLLFRALSTECEASVKVRDKSTWVDPNDMLGDDSRSYRKVRNLDKDKQRVEAEEKLPYEMPASNGEELTRLMAEAENRLASCEADSKSLADLLEKCENRTKQCDVLKELPFFKQYIHSLLVKLPHLSSAVDNSGSYLLDVRMTPEQFNYLQQYSKSGAGSVQEVHDILSSALLKNIRWIETDPKANALIDWELLPSRTGVLLQMVAILALSAHALSVVVKLHFHSYGRLVFALITLSFFISIPWTWWHLYKQKLAERHTMLMKGHGSTEACLSNHQSFTSRLNAWLFGPSDECAKYYEKMEIDPMWEVPPSQAVAVTFIRFFLEPAGHIGEAIRLLMTRAFDGLPFYLWAPMLVILTVIIVLSLFLVSGYRLRTLLFSIEPHRQPAVPAIPENVQQELNQLRYDVNHLRQENLELRDSNERLAIHHAGVEGGVNRVGWVDGRRELEGGGDGAVIRFRHEASGIRRDGGGDSRAEVRNMVPSSSSNTISPALSEGCMETSGGFSLIQGGGDLTGERRDVTRKEDLNVDASNQRGVDCAPAGGRGIEVGQCREGGGDGLSASGRSADEIQMSADRISGGGDGSGRHTKDTLNQTTNLTKSQDEPVNISGGSIKDVEAGVKNMNLDENLSRIYEADKPTSQSKIISGEVAAEPTGRVEEIINKTATLSVDQAEDKEELKCSVTRTDASSSDVSAGASPLLPARPAQASSAASVEAGSVASREAGSAASVEAGSVASREAGSAASVKTGVPGAESNPTSGRRLSAEDDSDYEIIEPDIRTSFN